MQELRTAADLIRILGEVAGSEDPLAELRRRGARVTGELEQALRQSSPSRALTPAKRRRFARLATQSKVTFRVRTPAPRQLRRYAPDDFDVICGVHLTLVDEIVNALHSTHRIPPRIEFGRVLSESQRAQLASLLSGAFPTIPDGAEVGTLTIRTGIATAAVHETETVLVDLPFGLELVQEVVDADGVSRRQSVGSLVGSLALVARLGAEVRTLEDAAGAVLVFSMSFPPYPTQGAPQLVIDADSTFQPDNPEQLPALALLLQNALATYFEPAFDVSPSIDVPVLPGAQLIVERIDALSVETSDGDLLVAGVRFAGGNNSPPDLGRLSSLRPEPGRNVVIRVHERYLESLLEAARTNGELDRIAQEQTDGARITSTGVEFEPGEIRVIVGGHVPNLCGWVDVDFTVTKVIQFRFEGETVRIEQSTEVDVSNADMIICVVMAFFVALVVSLPFLLISPIIGGIMVLFITGLLADSPTPGGSVKLIRLDSPIPGTELLPVIDQLLSRVEESALVASATVSLRPDDINTYMYVRVLRKLMPLEPGQPIAGARVQVCDQDAPAPSGDDADLPSFGETTRMTANNRFMITVTTSYEPATRNPVLAEGSTNSDGLAMLHFPPSQGATAGYVITQTTKETYPQHTIVSQTQSRKPIVERGPDIFFLVTAMSQTIDSRDLPGGRLANYSSRRLGDARRPAHTVGPAYRAGFSVIQAMIVNLCLRRPLLTRRSPRLLEGLGRGDIDPPLGMR